MKGNTKNCIYTMKQIPKMKCDGKMVHIGAKAQNKQMACMYKCVDASFASKRECER